MINSLAILVLSVNPFPVFEDLSFYLMNRLGLVE